ncbi:MAG: protein-L-isoaspartate(D-aspartate) O-methyltransferase [Candidatus Kerfeldbacteria bacterium]|nr:protein-L-isoaspartate(D-aspartate) O-methyltransferase [Candidatus Kerfeldbacteria bacterium]
MAEGGYLRELLQSGVLRTSPLIAAFERIDRAAFIPASVRDAAALNIPLPIGHAQTISQPWTVAFMLEALQPQPGDAVLDVGSGSGWATALLADLVGPRGHVYAIERIPALRAFGERNVLRAGLRNVTFATGDGSRGWPAAAPFQRIHVAAAAPRAVPEPLKEQLAVGGRLIIPVGEWTQTLVLVTRKDPEQFTERRYPDFQFVPLVSDHESSPA